MSSTRSSLKDVLVFNPRVFQDQRGFFKESYNRTTLGAHGVSAEFVQDNFSSSARNVLRGLHYQIDKPQGKLVQVTMGEVLDVIVDLRCDSPTFGQWETFRLSACNHRQLWIPPGFAHGFYVLSDGAHFVYKTTEFYSHQGERIILWNDPDLAIDWELQGEPLLSDKDQLGIYFKSAPVFNATSMRTNEKRANCDNFV
jgi:dTDP-4-dehydrorhamnose 3,5-epimerase